MTWHGHHCGQVDSQLSQVSMCQRVVRLQDLDHMTSTAIAGMHQAFPKISWMTLSAASWLDSRLSENRSNKPAARKVCCGT